VRPLAALLLFAVFVLYAGRLSVANLLLGACLTLLSVWAGMPKSPINWKRFPGAVAALTHLAWNATKDTLRAGATVAGIAFRRNLRLTPGVLRVPLGQGLSPSSRALVSHMLTLTPGELVLDEEGDVLVVHTLILPEDLTRLNAGIERKRALWMRVEALWKIP
jgi:multisubunit Na+/H+ antiporter MnhE subunit